MRQWAGKKSTSTSRTVSHQWLLSNRAPQIHFSSNACTFGLPQTHRQLIPVVFTGFIMLTIRKYFVKWFLSFQICHLKRYASRRVPGVRLFAAFSPSYFLFRRVHATARRAFLRWPEKRARGNTKRNEAKILYKEPIFHRDIENGNQSPELRLNWTVYLLCYSGEK